MTINLGDFPDLHTAVVVFFNAFDSNDPSASVIVSDFVVGDVAVYKNGGVTQRTSTNGYTLLDTDGINFDGLVGVHGVSIDLSDDTDTDFFEPGAEYDVIIGPITIDAAAVTFHAAHFSIERAGGVLALLKGGTDGLAAHTTLLNDIPTVAEFDARTLVAASYFDPAADTVANVTTVATLTGHTAQTADHTAAIADIPTVAEFNARTLVAASYFDPAADTVANVTTVATLTGHTAQTADHTAGIADIPTVAEFNARTLVAASYFDPAADTVANVTTVATLTGHTAQTADHTAGIADIPTVAEFNARTILSASYFDPAVDAVADVTLVATTTTNTDMRGTDSAATEAKQDIIDTVVDAIKVVTDKMVFTINNLLDVNTKAISDDTAAADSLEAMMDGVLVITVNDASATTTAFATDGFTEATDDHFNGRLMTFITGALAFQQTDITDYDAAGGAQGSQEFTVSALTEAPANNDIAIIH